MKQAIRSALRKAVPFSMIDHCRIMICRQRVKSALSLSSDGPSRLDRENLDSLIEKYRDRGIYFDGAPTINRSIKRVPFKSVTVDTCGKNTANEILAMGATCSLCGASILSVLFERGMLDDFVEESGQYPIRYNELNGWSLNQYRELWDRFGTRFKPMQYREWSTLNSLDLVQQFLECFRGRIDDLYVASIRALFQKVPFF